MNRRRDVLSVTGVAVTLALACSSSSGTTSHGTGATKEFAWTEAAPCPVARFEANGVLVDGEVWVMGGFTGSDLAVTRRIDIYDPATDTWRQGPDLPGAETHLAVVNTGTDLIVAGGFSGGFPGGQRPPVTDAVWRLTSGASTWTPGPALPTRGSGFSWGLIGTSFHIAGGLAGDGNSDASVHYVWDIAGTAQWATGAALPNARNHGGGAVSGGILYAVSGRHGWNESSGDDDDVHAFDPESGTWASVAPIPLGRSEIGASTFTLADGRIIVIGGSLPGIMPTDDVLAYDPVGDEWSTPLPKLPAKRKGAVAVLFEDKIVVSTGSPTSTDPIATTYVGCCL